MQYIVLDFSTTRKGFARIFHGNRSSFCAPCMSLRNIPVVIARRRNAPTWQSALSAQPTEGVYRRNESAMPGFFRRKNDPSVGEGLAPPETERFQSGLLIGKMYRFATE